ncbi:glycerophosphodiester phosphodiesterase [Staphylococcus sp. 11261D007BR]
MTKTTKRITQSIIGLSSVVGGILLYQSFKKPSQQKTTKPFFQHESPYIFSHRGGMLERPECTTLAFDHSVAMGLTGFETDIRLTKDEQVVIFHDADVDRTTNGSGLVSDYTLEELKALDAGYHFKDINGNYPYRNHPEAKILTLSELLDRYPTQLINIDIKDHPDSYEGSIVPQRLFDIIQQKQAEHRVLVTSFHHTQIERFNLYNDGSIAIGASQKEVTEAIVKRYSGLGSFYEGYADTLQMPTQFKNIPLVHKSLIRWLKSRNIVPGYYGINSVDKMHDLVEMGVHTIVTDRPTLGRQYLTLAQHHTHV